MFSNDYGYAIDAVCIMRNAFLAIFTSGIHNVWTSKTLKNCHIKFLIHILSIWWRQHFNNLLILTHCTSCLKNATLTFFILVHSALDTLEHWAKIVAYVTVEFPIAFSYMFYKRLILVNDIMCFDCSDSFIYIVVLSQ